MLVFSVRLGVVKGNSTPINVKNNLGQGNLVRDGSIYSLTGDISGFIEIEKNDILVDGKGFSLKGLGDGIGVLVDGKRNVTIQNLHVEGFNHGVLVNSSSNIILSNNTLIDNNGTGLLFESMNNSVISHNKILGNTRGIRAFSSSNNTVFDNNVSLNGLSGIGFEAQSNFNEIYDNTMEGNSRYGIWLFDNSYQNKVYENTIKQSLYGILVPLNSNFNQITRNTISNCSLGLWLDGSSNNKIQENTITGSGDGIWLYSSSNNNQITKNTIANNQYGFLIYNLSQSNQITENNVKNNSIGIWLSESTNNIFYHNNFENILQILSENSTNFWDNGFPSGGNYWSDYKEKYPDMVETGDSGLGNTAYVIDQNNKDNYPLINPYTMQPETFFPSWIMVIAVLVIIAGIVFVVFFWRRKNYR